MWWTDDNIWILLDVCQHIQHCVCMWRCRCVSPHCYVSLGIAYFPAAHIFINEVYLSWSVWLCYINWCGAVVCRLGQWLEVGCLVGSTVDGCVCVCVEGWQGCKGSCWWWWWYIVALLLIWHTHTHDCCCRKANKQMKTPPPPPADWQKWRKFVWSVKKTLQQNCTIIFICSVFSFVSIFFVVWHVPGFEFFCIKMLTFFFLICWFFGTTTSSMKIIWTNLLPFVSAVLCLTNNN